MNKTFLLLVTLSFPILVIGAPQTERGNETGNREIDNKYLDCLKGFLENQSNYVEGYEKNLVTGTMMVNGKMQIYIVDKNNNSYLIPFPEKGQANITSIVQDGPGSPRPDKKVNFDKVDKVVSEESIAVVELNNKKTALYFSKSAIHRIGSTDEKDPHHGAMAMVLYTSALKEFKNSGMMTVARPAVFNKIDKEKIVPLKFQMDHYKIANHAEIFTLFLNNKIISDWDWRSENDRGALKCGEDNFHKTYFLENITKLYNTTSSCMESITNTSVRDTLQSFTQKIETFAKNNHLKLEDNKFVLDLNCKEKNEVIDSSGRGVMQKEQGNEELNLSPKNSQK